MQKIAGSFGPFAIVRHRGRRTGRTYATPVLAFGTEDGLVVDILDGTTSDWVRNVLAGDGQKSNGTVSHVRVMTDFTSLSNAHAASIGEASGIRRETK